MSNETKIFSFNLNWIYKILIVITIPCISISQPLATGHGKFLGNIFAGSNVPTNFFTYWDQITPENAGKWGSVEGTRNSYNWGTMDAIYNHAIQNGLPIRFHTLVWGQQYPTWMDQLDPASQLAEVEEWIRLVAERYPRVNYVDVVNEPLPGHAPAPYRNALGGSGATGYDWVIKSFELARKYFGPHVELHINDYNIINSNSNTITFRNIINLLKARGLIDGIGIQGHRFEVCNVSNATLKYNLDILAATGLPIYITELDIGKADNETYDEHYQLTEYQRIFPLLWGHPAIKGITLWGYIQGMMWQPNCYLIRSNGTFTSAMTWLRNYLTTNNYRSRQSGNWSDVNVWEKYDGTNWINPAPSIPTVTSGSVTILNGHSLVVSADDSIDQLTVMSGGTLEINNGVKFVIKDGAGADLVVYGSLKNSGIIEKSTTASIKVSGNGKYEHKQDGGTIPQCEWEIGTTCELTSIVNATPQNIAQKFYHLVWNCPNQATDLSLGWENGVIIKGNLIVTNTNWNRLSTIAPSNHLKLFNGNGSCTLGGLIINGSNAALTSSYTDTVLITGNVTLSNNGMLLLSNSNSFSTIYQIKGDLIVTDSAYIGKSVETNASKIVFNKAGEQKLRFPTIGVNMFGGVNIEVAEGSTLDLGSSVVTGTGSFVFNGGATFQTAHANGINGNIQCSGTYGGGNIFSSAGSYIFSGTTAQVTGSYLPAELINLTINNSSGVTLSNSVTVNGVLEMKSGALTIGDKVLSYGQSGTLKYSGSSVQSTSDREFPAINGPKQIVINNGYGVTLHASREIAGNVELIAGKFSVGANTLTANEIINAVTSRYIVTTGGGKLKLRSVGTGQKLYPIGTSFYAPVWISNTGEIDNITVGVISESTPAPYGGRLNVKWNTEEETAGGGNYTMQFGWMTNLENAAFKNDRTGNAKIYTVPDTAEVGTGAYTMQFTTLPYTLMRSGISNMGSFVIGGFGKPTSVDRDDNIIPLTYSLSQNYPNPFNPATKINYSVPKVSFITLKVYNILGQEVAILFEGIQQPGNYEITFDARELSNGMYLYRMQANDYVETKKLILIK